MFLTLEKSTFLCSVALKIAKSVSLRCCPPPLQVLFIFSLFLNEKSWGDPWKLFYLLSHCYCLMERWLFKPKQLSVFQFPHFFGKKSIRLTNLLNMYARTKACEQSSRQKIYKLWLLPGNPISLSAQLLQCHFRLLTLRLTHRHIIFKAVGAVKGLFIYTR